MDYNNLPIDIHVGKLLDWLIDRRFCDRTWARNKEIFSIKFTDFIEKLPLDINESLKNEYSNYHKLLHLKSSNIISDDYTKKELEELLTCFQKNGYGLAETVYALISKVINEIPVYRKNFNQNEQDSKILQRKESSLSSMLESLEKSLEITLSNLNIKSLDIDKEISDKRYELESMINDILNLIIQLEPLIKSLLLIESVQKFQKFEFLLKVIHFKSMTHSDVDNKNLDLCSNEIRSLIIEELLFLQSFLKQKKFEREQNNLSLELDDTDTDFESYFDEIDKNINLLDKLLLKLNDLKLTNLFLFVNSEIFRTRFIQNVTSIKKKIDYTKNNISSLTNQQMKLEKDKINISMVLGDLIQQSKTLRSKISSEISKKYNNRFVNIMADIN